MLRKKLSACFVAALIFLFASLNFKSAFAQEIPLLYGVYPQRGSLGTEVNLLLSGDGFHSLGELSSVQISGQEIPVLDYAVVSNQLIRVLILIPEQTATGETEISFLFDNMGMDAYFVVIEGGDQEISPVIRQINPQDGQVDTEMTLFFEGTRLFELGELGGVIIGDVEIPVIDGNIESDQSMFIAIYLPLETPIGETEISVFFENYSFEEFFFVRRQGPRPEEPGITNLRGLNPQEGEVDTEIELFLEGENLFELGGLIGVSINGIDIPVLDYAIESNESMVIVVYMPPDLPTGETGIAFFFENYSFEEFFFIRGQEPGPEEPGITNLRGLNPQEGEVDTEIELFLEGENLFELGGLIGVSISGIDIPVLDYEVESNESMVMRVYLPEDTPRGGQIIAIFFENAGLEESFFVSVPPEIPIPTVVVVVVVVVVSGVLVGRFLRGRRIRTERLDEKSTQPQAKIDFIVAVDPGTQSVELSEPSLTMGINLRFEIEVDPGNQSVEPDGNSLINSE